MFLLLGTSCPLLLACLVLATVAQMVNRCTQHNKHQIKTCRFIIYDVTIRRAQDKHLRKQGTRARGRTGTFCKVKIERLVDWI